MTAELVTPHPLARGASWIGRASRRGRAPLLEQSPGPGSPVGGLWASLVEVLGAIDGPSAALLATADGDPLAVHGLARRRTSPGWRARAGRPSRPAPRAGRTRTGPSTRSELTLGLRHTVIASVPSPESERHLLTVTAQGVSVQVLEAWTRQLADDIHQALSTTG